MDNIQIICLIFIIVSIFVWCKTPKTCEGFEQQTEKYVLKTNKNLYDNFYSKLYDSLVFSEHKNKFEINILKNTANLDKNSVILDIGSGTGNHCRLLEKEVNNCIGLDLSSNMIKLAKKQAPKTTFIQGDALNSMVVDNNTFTHITVFYFTIYYFKDKLQFLQNVYGWLKPGGYLILHLVNKYKFDPILPAGDPLIMVSAQKYAKKRITNTVVKFDNFKYKANFTMSESNIANFDEKFTFDNGNVRHNKHKFYMENQSTILNLAKELGFILIAKIDMATCQYEQQFIYVLQKPS